VDDPGRLLQLAHGARRHAPTGRGRRQHANVPRRSRGGPAPPRPLGQAASHHPGADLTPRIRGDSADPRLAGGDLRPRSRRSTSGGARAKRARQTPADRRPTRDQHGLGRSRRAPLGSHGGGRTAEEHGRIHSGDQPRRSSITRPRLHRAQLGAPQGPLPLRALRALPRHLLPIRRSPLGDTVRAPSPRSRTHGPTRLVAALGRATPDTKPGSGAARSNRDLHRRSHRRVVGPRLEHQRRFGVEAARRRHARAASRPVGTRGRDAWSLPRLPPGTGRVDSRTATAARHRKMGTVHRPELATRRGTVGEPRQGRPALGRRHARLGGMPDWESPPDDDGGHQ
jgi:hypothetical protein